MHLDPIQTQLPRFIKPEQDHALLWNGIDSGFVDIDPKTSNLDPAKIEAAVIPQTMAIMPVHCYGHPYDTVANQQIAGNHYFCVIYDSVHTVAGAAETARCIRRAA